MAKRFGLSALLILGGVLSATPVFAADKTTSDDDSSSSKSSDGEADGDKDDADGEKATEKDADKDAKKGDAKAAEAEDPETSPVEDPTKSYKFVGARFRLIVVPQFILGMFADGGKTVVVPAGGPEFGVRKDNFEFNFALWLASYGMGPTPFKAKSDGEDAWEIVESQIKVLYLTTDLMWSTPFSPQVALTYGMGAGLGIVWGPLKRNQAYKAADGSYQKCIAVGNPNPAYCGGDNDHYGNYEEPNWSNGGSKPMVFPWLAAQTGLRYKPHKKFVGRLDLGFGLSGFFIGLGADYGL